MPLSIPELARRLNINESRARHLVQSGRIRGQRIGGRWLVDEADAAQYRPGAPAGRPLSERNAWLFAVAASNAWKSNWKGDASNILIQISPVERYRLNQRLQRWEEAAFSFPLLLSLLANRADRIEFSASPADLRELKEDPRLRPSGVSHPDAGLLANSELEAYVNRDDVDAVVKDWFLIKAEPGQRANVVLHVAEEVPDKLPLIMVAADLAERPGAREQQAARALVRSIHAD
ncbi:helix-turn-helix domain-containing protein [Arthrobacter sp. S13_S34]|jgi:excisionase family DNA binding protein|nr:helix-turn-helix domain-containing protein [Arthrobacter sp. S13_S34]